MTCDRSDEGNHADSGMFPNVALQRMCEPGAAWRARGLLTADGRVVEGAEADVTYEKPGQYSETLVVRTDTGAEDHDYLQVRIYDPERGRDIARGWIYHHPVRGISPGTVVTFENRVLNDGNGAVFDFGDGSEPKEVGEYRDVEHVYETPGIYDVALAAENAHGEKTTIRMRVIVESSAQ